MVWTEITRFYHNREGLEQSALLSDRLSDLIICFFVTFIRKSLHTCGRSY